MRGPRMAPALPQFRVSARPDGRAASAVRCAEPLTAPALAYRRGPSRGPPTGSPLSPVSHIGATAEAHGVRGPARQVSQAGRVTSRQSGLGTLGEIEAQVLELDGEIDALEAHVLGS